MAGPIPFRSSGLSAAVNLPGLSRYQRSLLHARRVGLALMSAQQAYLKLLLDSYATDLANTILPTYQKKFGQNAALNQAKIQTALMRKELQQLLESGVDATVSSMAAAHARATWQLALANGQSPAGLGVNFAAVNVLAPQAVLARPALTAAMNTVRKGAQEVADKLILRSLAEGWTADRLGKQLRLSIVGAETLPSALVQDRRKITRKNLEALGIPGTELEAIRQEAGTVAWKAMRIARTEISNAEHEAGIRLAEESPVVEGIQWALSNRHPETDTCDVYAQADLYGLGAGVYDPRAVPPRPHPHCLCIRYHKVLPPEEWGKPRGKLPKLKLGGPKDVAAFQGAALELPQSQVRQLEQGLQAAEFRRSAIRKEQAVARLERMKAAKAAKAAANAASPALLQKADELSLLGAQLLEQVSAEYGTGAPKVLAARRLQSRAVAYGQEVLGLEKAMGAQAVTDLRVMADTSQDLAAKRLQFLLGERSKAAASRLAAYKAQKAAQAAAAEAAKHAAIRTELQAAIDAAEAKLAQAVKSYTPSLAAEAAAELQAILDKLVKQGPLPADLWPTAAKVKLTAQVQEQRINAYKFARNRKAQAEKWQKKASELTAAGKFGEAKDAIQKAADAAVGGHMKLIEASQTWDTAKAVHGLEWPASGAKLTTELAEIIKAKQPILQAIAKLEVQASAAYQQKVANLKKDLQAQSSASFQAAEKNLVGAQKTVVLNAELLLQDAHALGDPDLIDVAKGVLQKSQERLAETQAYNKAKHAKAQAAKKSAKAATAPAPAVSSTSSQAAAASKAAAAPVKLPPQAALEAVVEADADTILYQQLQGASGSNPGGVYLGKDGVKRYVKFYTDEAQARGELLANSIYKRLGLNAPESQLFRTADGKLAHAAPFLDVKGTVQAVGLQKKVANEILDGFAADVLTANWDAIGLSMDNVVVLANGQVARIDQGGSLLMRAQKARRKELKLLEQITEWDNFANASINPSYRKVFDVAGVQDAIDLGERVIGQIKAIVELENKAGGWDNYVRQMFPTWRGADRDAIASMLHERTKLLAKKMGQIEKELLARQQMAARSAQLAQEAEARRAQRYVRTDRDKKWIGNARQRLQASLTTSNRTKLKQLLSGTQTQSNHALRGVVSSERRGVLVDFLVDEYGLSPSRARQAVAAYDGMFDSWQGSTHNNGALALKYLAYEAEGVEIHNLDTFLDHDAAKVAKGVDKARRQVENILKNNGFQVSDMPIFTDLLKTERNFMRAVGDLLQLQEVELHREVQTTFWNLWNQPVPRTGETVTAQLCSLTGFTHTRGAYGSQTGFTVRVRLEDILRSYFTHDGQRFTNEREVWTLGGTYQVNVYKGRSY